jgi:hypothetical protein
LQDSLNNPDGFELSEDISADAVRLVLDMIYDVEIEVPEDLEDQVDALVKEWKLEVEWEQDLDASSLRNVTHDEMEIFVASPPRKRAPVKSTKAETNKKKSKPQNKKASKALSRVHPRVNSIKGSKDPRRSVLNRSNVIAGDGKLQNRKTRQARRSSTFNYAGCKASCVHCRKRFPSKRSAYFHGLLCEDNPNPGKPFKCSFCPKTYILKHRLDIHQAQHTDSD